MTSIPHFVYPLSLTSQGVAVAEQDSPEEIASCVRTILRTPLGWRPEAPTIGCPDLTFTIGDVRATLEQAAERGEPRVTAFVEQSIDVLDSAINEILIVLSRSAP